MKGLDNYKTGRKNNWRRTCWNEIARRVPDRKNANILILAGEQDLDRPVAISKGFSSNNIIAVDLRKEVVDKLRKEGKLAIHGSIQAASLILEPDVIHADLVCGLREPAFDLMMATLFFGWTKPGTVILCNFQRGREIGETAKLMYLAQDMVKTGAMGMAPEQAKHRGLLFFTLMRCKLMGLLEDAGFDKRTIDNVKIACSERMNPYFSSYKSECGAVFDTVIFTTIFPRTARTFGELHIEDRPVRIDGVVRGAFKGREMEKMRRKVTAIKAVQTMRKNGTLDPCRNW
jgi:hypothetical protein